MINIAKKIFEKKIDDECHYFFVRYGKGVFEKEPTEIKITKNNIKLYGGFDMIKIFLKIFSESTLNDQDEKNILINGTIISSRDLSNLLKSYNIKFDVKKRYGKIGNKYLINAELNKEEFAKFIEEFAYNEYLLLKVKSKKRSLSVKKDETPKPNKLVERFVVLSLSKEDKELILDEFLFDCKKEVKEKLKDMDNVTIKINRLYSINKIHVDEELIEKNPEKARIEAKREGTIKRDVEIRYNSKEEKYCNTINFLV